MVFLVTRTIIAAASGPNIEMASNGPHTPFDSSMAHPDWAPVKIQLTQSSANVTTRKRMTVPLADLTDSSESIADTIPQIEAVSGIGPNTQTLRG